MECLLCSESVSKEPRKGAIVDSEGVHVCAREQVAVRMTVPRHLSMLSRDGRLVRNAYMFTHPMPPSF